MLTKKLLLIAILLIVALLSVLFLVPKNDRIGLEVPKPKSDTTNLYQECSGVPFEGSCNSGECIDAGIEKRVFGLWKQQFQRIHNLSNKYFDDHIVVIDVSYREGTYGDTTFNWWRIDYVYQNDWVKSRQNESVDLPSSNDFTTMSAITDKTIIQLLNISIESAEKFDASVIPFAELEKLIRSNKINAQDLDFCHIDFANITGTLFLHGISVINEILNRCESLAIDLNGGKVSKMPSPCVVF